MSTPEYKALKEMKEQGEQDSLNEGAFDSLISYIEKLSDEHQDAKWKNGGWQVIRYDSSHKLSNGYPIHTTLSKKRAEFLAKFLNAAAKFDKHNTYTFKVEFYQ